jgi:hypothetical protein
MMRPPEFLMMRRPEFLMMRRPCAAMRRHRKNPARTVPILLLTVYQPPFPNGAVSNYVLLSN